MGGEEDILGGAMNMAATGVGLGIMTMGAMVPITIMKKMAQDGVSANVKTPKGKKKKVQVTLPKINVSTKMPSTKIKKFKLK